MHPGPLSASSRAGGRQRKTGGRAIQNGKIRGRAWRAGGTAWIASYVTAAPGIAAGIACCSSPPDGAPREIDAGVDVGVDHLVAVPCPTSLPAPGTVCPAEGRPFLSLVCTGDCWRCWCGETWTCRLDECADVCPTLPPANGDACSSAYDASCGFGDSADGGCVRNCECRQSTWHCTSSSTCPECPSGAPTPGTACEPSPAVCLYPCVACRCGECEGGATACGAWTCDMLCVE